MKTELDGFRSRRDVMRSAEGREEIVENVFVGQIDISEMPTKRRAPGTVGRIATPDYAARDDQISRPSQGRVAIIQASRSRSSCGNITVKSMMPRLWPRTPRLAVTYAAILIALIAFSDWRVEINATLGFLYIFPMMLLGTVFGWWELLLAALFCTFLSDRLDPFPMEMESARDVLIFLTLAVTGLLSLSLTRSYRRERERFAALHAAEEQLKFLIESSPAAILTMTAAGEMLLGNPAAHRLLGVAEGSLSGKNITRYIPALGSIPSVDETTNIFRTEMQTRGQRQNGEFFLADVFFSTYSTPAGPRLAAMVVDTSEHLREREESSLQQLLAGSRIVVAAVSHEIRNVCAAIGVMHENLARKGSLKGDQDFEALGSLLETLGKIASLELKRSVGAVESSSADLREVLADFRIVLGQMCEESDIQLHWSVPDKLPLVQADRHSLMQVLLNLAKNSQRALESAPEKAIDVAVSGRTDGVSIRFTDSGPGIPPDQKIFQPLQKGAEATGLGLYLSRAFMRSFGGDLRHDPNHPGCSFVLELAGAAKSSALSEHATPTTLTA
jgi:two-component system, LuxR family, sensor kinase FixL